MTAATSYRPCPVCQSRIYRAQHSGGVVVVYPCNHWLTLDQAQQLADQHRANQGRQS